MPAAAIPGTLGGDFGGFVVIAFKTVKLSPTVKPILNHFVSSISIFPRMRNKLNAGKIEIDDICRN